MDNDAPKDEAAAAMARKRWANTTPEERSEVGRAIVNARWAKRRAAQQRNKRRAAAPRR